MKIDEALNKVGDSGRYQIIILILFIAQFMVSVFVLLGPLYFLPDPEFICANGEKCTEYDGGCINQQLVNQNGYETMTSTFKLYCNNKEYRSLASSIMFIAPIISLFLMSYISDIKGRRFVTLISWLICTIGIIGVTFAPSPLFLIISLFLSGYGIVPCNSFNFMMINESFGQTFRQKSSLILVMSWPLWQIVYVPIVYYIKNWQTIYIYFIMVPSIVICILNYYLLIETPRFLLNQGDQKQLIKELNKIAVINKRIEIEESTKIIQEIIKQKKTYNYHHLFIYKSLRLVTIAISLIQLCTQLIYYGNQYALSKIGNNIYLNAILIVLGELFTYIVINFTIENIFRKRFTIIFLTLTISICFLFLFNLPSVLEIIFAVCIRISNSAVAGINVVFQEELFPTPVRGLGVGFSMGIGLIGAALAPYIAEWSVYFNVPQVVLLGILAIPSIFMSFFLKETRQLPLQDEITEEVVAIQQDELNTFLIK